MGSPASFRAHSSGAGSWHVAGCCATLWPRAHSSGAGFGPRSATWTIEVFAKAASCDLSSDTMSWLRAWVAPHTIGNRPAAARVRAAGLRLPDGHASPGPGHGSTKGFATAAHTAMVHTGTRPRQACYGLLPLAAAKQGPPDLGPRAQQLSVFVVVLLLLAPAGPHPPRGGSQGKLLDRLPRRHLLELPLLGCLLPRPSCSTPPGFRPRSRRRGLRPWHVASS